MSKRPRQPTNHAHLEHKTAESYVVGFILSLIFTFIPYYMVVNKTVTGSALLYTILGFGVLQMLVQIIFFLHLGRGPKPFYNVGFYVATVGAIIVVVGGSVVIINNLHYNMSVPDQTKKLIADEGIYQIGGEKTGACQGQHNNYKVVIKNGQVTPLHTLANQCDTLTFINEDRAPREITFGTHPHHAAYAGDDELPVLKGRNKTITLSELGTFQFHDHLQAETAGDFTVAP